MNGCLENSPWDFTRAWKNSNGELHREDGPAYIGKDFTLGWYINGKRHRVGGPAIIFPWGAEEWFIEDKLHRLDGPAITNSPDTKYSHDSIKQDMWFINGVELPTEIIDRWMKEQQVT